MVPYGGMQVLASLLECGNSTVKAAAEQQLQVWMHFDLPSTAVLTSRSKVCDVQLSNWCVSAPKRLVVGAGGVEDAPR